MGSRGFPPGGGEAQGVFRTGWSQAVEGEGRAILGNGSDIPQTLTSSEVPL